jgi:hypothetical protein
MAHGRRRRPGRQMAFELLAERGNAASFGKALGIMNEQLLALRLRALGCRLVDVTWLSTRLSRLGSNGEVGCGWSSSWPAVIAIGCFSSVGLADYVGANRAARFWRSGSTAHPAAKPAHTSGATRRPATGRASVRAKRTAVKRPVSRCRIAGGRLADVLHRHQWHGCAGSPPPTPGSVLGILPIQEERFVEPPGRSKTSPSRHQTRA